MAEVEEELVQGPLVVLRQKCASRLPGEARFAGVLNELLDGMISGHLGHARVVPVLAHVHRVLVNVGHLEKGIQSLGQVLRPIEGQYDNGRVGKIGLRNTLMLWLGWRFNFGMCQSGFLGRMWWCLFLQLLWGLRDSGRLRNLDGERLLH
eukprot:GAFH01004733.1.p2 GENE.GAFH01004733.1~~GAFH01004733.1.p2  ORF type:complete len:167 (+),score=24.02 GAFH01004733.1:53-502(+)